MQDYTHTHIIYIQGDLVGILKTVMTCSWVDLNMPENVSLH